MGLGERERPGNWQSFVAFWLLAGITLLALGIAMFATVRHGHRVGGVIAFLGLLCLTFALVLRRAGKRGG
jgi:uncharacterized membrane protein